MPDIKVTCRSWYNSPLVITYSRLYMTQKENGLFGELVDDSRAKTFGVMENDLYQAARVNGPLLLPPVIKEIHIPIIAGTQYLVTNVHGTFGHPS